MNSTNGTHAHAESKSNENLEPAGKVAREIEAAACLRVLVCFATCDGPLAARELAVLEEAWDELELPESMTLPELSCEDINISHQLKQIKSEEGRERTYTATYLLAHSGGPRSAKQQEALDNICTGLHISKKMATPLSRIYGEIRNVIFPAHNKFIDDPAMRMSKVNDEILKTSLRNAVTGAFPIQTRSLATGIIIFSAQAVMVGDIGQFWGFTLNKESTRLLMASIQGETGMRLAVQSLQHGVTIVNFALGSNSAFVTTWALGSVANKQFESGRKLTAETLRELYVKALKEAGSVYETTSHDAVNAAVKSRSITLELLGEDFESGQISSEEYDRKILGMQ